MPEKSEDPKVTNDAEIIGRREKQAAPTPGLSVSPDLTEVPDSPVPGADRSHVYGPQQAAADPVLAGLDTQYDPATRNELRSMTDGEGHIVAPPSDEEANAVPGPTGASIASTVQPAVVEKQAEAQPVDTTKPADMTKSNKTAKPLP